MPRSLTPLRLSDEQLDQLSKVTPQDLIAAEAWARERGRETLRELLEAPEWEDEDAGPA